MRSKCCNKLDIKLHCEENAAKVARFLPRQYSSQLFLPLQYFILYTLILSISESISDPRLYEDFYEHLEHEIDEIGSKTQGFFIVCCIVDCLIAFSVLLNRIEPLKPLVTKLQKKKKRYLPTVPND